MYSHLITTFFDDKECNYFIAPALDIKRPIGIVRGKDDKVDAKGCTLWLSPKR